VENDHDNDEIIKIKTFLFELPKISNNTNQIDLRIHTTDKHLKVIPQTYNYMGSIPTTKFLFSKMLTQILLRQRNIPDNVRNKYFRYIRNKIINRLDDIESRLSANDNRNLSTKTYFTFRYNSVTFRFGIYILVIMVKNNRILKQQNYPIPKIFYVVLHQAPSSCHVYEAAADTTYMIYFLLNNLTRM